MEFSDLPHLPLKIIFDELSFQDILNLLWTPSIRPIVLNYFRVDMNMKDLIRLGLLEIFDRLLRRSRYFYENLHNYLVKRGMVDFYLSDRYSRCVQKFASCFTKEELTNAYPDLVDFKDCIVSKFSMHEMLVNVLIADNISCNITARHRQLHKFLEVAEYDIEDFERQHIADFLEVYFYDQRNGFRNTLMMFEKIPKMKYVRKSEMLRKHGIEKPQHLLDLIEKIFVT